MFLYLVVYYFRNVWLVVLVFSGWFGNIIIFVSFVFSSCLKESRCLVNMWWLDKCVERMDFDELGLKVGNCIDEGERFLGRYFVWK